MSSEPERSRKFRTRMRRRSASAGDRGNDRDPFRGNWPRRKRDERREETPPKAERRGIDAPLRCRGSWSHRRRLTRPGGGNDPRRRKSWGWSRSPAAYTPPVRMLYAEIRPLTEDVPSRNRTRVRVGRRRQWSRKRSAVPEKPQKVPEAPSCPARAYRFRHARRDIGRRQGFGSAPLAEASRCRSSTPEAPRRRSSTDRRSSHPENLHRSREEASLVRTAPRCGSANVADGATPLRNRQRHQKRRRPRKRCRPRSLPPLEAGRGSGETAGHRRRDARTW